MAFVVNFTPGESFDETGDTITLAKLNRVINSGYGVIASGSLDEDNIGDGEVSAAKLKEVLDLTGKTVTLPVGIDLSKGIATGTDIGTDAGELGVPAYKGQIGILEGAGAGVKAGRIFIAKGTASTADWVFAGYLNIDGSDTTSFGVPDQLGQWAMDSAGMTYRAVALTGDADAMWMPVRSKSVDLVHQGSDPDHLDFTGSTGSGNIRLYNKSNQLYMLQDDGTVVQVTGTQGAQSIYLRYKESQGIDGDAITSETWTSVPLNQEAGMASVESGGTYPWFVAKSGADNYEITLAAGTYSYNYMVCFNLESSSLNYTECRARLYLSNDPPGPEVIDYSASSTNVVLNSSNASYQHEQHRLRMVGEFTLAGQKDLRLQAYAAGTGVFFGSATGTGSGAEPSMEEVYAYIKITLLS
jgi:hypothetical protein